ncbi:unnamed protein product [Timema podura]|uniref:EB domain-containing protein n=1 Tax=Timema podura TaxID=61482 RepID=A0ABN7P289_TIMPD|nr:unnamed protein product [Timema podura]
MVIESPGRTVISIGATLEKFKDVIPDVLASHALSGCDTTASYFDIGKTKVFNTLQKVRYRFNESCVENQQCNLTEGGLCKVNRCECQDDYRITDNPSRCVRAVVEPIKEKKKYDSPQSWPPFYSPRLADLVRGSESSSTSSDKKICPIGTGSQGCLFRQCSGILGPSHEPHIICVWLFFSTASYYLFKIYNHYSGVGTKKEAFYKKSTRICVEGERETLKERTTLNRLYRVSNLDLPVISRFDWKVPDGQRVFSSSACASNSEDFMCEQHLCLQYWIHPFT